MSASFAADGCARIVGSARRSSSPSTPKLAARSSNACSTSAVAAASAYARCVGSTLVRKWRASVCKRRFGTSSRTRRRASASVSTRRFDEPRVSVRDERGVEERAVEADVVADDHRVADELEERRQHLGDPRRRAAPSTR